MSGLRSGSMQKTVKKPDTVQCVLYHPILVTQDHMDRCGHVPRHSFLGTGTGPPVSPLSLELYHDGSWWLVSVTAVVDSQKACLLLLLLTAEDSDGALSRSSRNV